jgi:long-chain acyl-CoA synthetase
MDLGHAERRYHGAAMLGDDLAGAAADPGCADRIALVDAERAFTYAELWRRIERARGWFERHVPAGARVAVVLDNSFELVVAIYGATRAGLIAVPVDAAIHPRNLDHVLADAEPAAIVSTRKHFQRIADCPALASLAPLRIEVAGGPGPDEAAAAHRAAGGARSGSATAGNRAAAPVAFDDLLAHPAPSQPSQPSQPSPPPAGDPDQPALIFYTTGTTGLRKGALLSHRALAAATRNINAFMQLAPGVTELVCMPLTHSFGLARMRCTFAARGTVVLARGLTRPQLVLDAIARHGVTSIGLVPMACRMLLDHYRAPLAAIAGQIRFLELGSDFLDRAYKEALLQLFPGARICMHYGLTEASRSCFLDLRAESPRLDTIGRPTPNVELALLDEAGAPVPPGEPGEICVRGDAVMLGYWRQPDLTAATLRDGWLRTGDLARADDAGYLHLLGRRSDVFKVAGFSVAPREIEAILAAHPGVAEAAVALCPSARAPAGELTALLVPASPADPPRTVELRKRCRDELESYKVPSRYLIVPSLPRTPSGKLRRTELSQLLTAGPPAPSDRSG